MTTRKSKKQYIVELMDVAFELFDFTHQILSFKTEEEEADFRNTYVKMARIKGFSQKEAENKYSWLLGTNIIRRPYLVSGNNQPTL